jgi:hypothetical protein
MITPLSAAITFANGTSYQGRCVNIVTVLSSAGPGFVLALVCGVCGAVCEHQLSMPGCVCHRTKTPQVLGVHQMLHFLHVP